MFEALPHQPGGAMVGYMDAAVTAILMGCAVVILAHALRNWGPRAGARRGGG